MSRLRDYYASLANNPNVRKALSFIAEAEGADYYTLVGQGTKNKALLNYGTSRHPKFAGWKGVYNPRVNAYSTAAGRYQIVGSTWQGLQRKGVVGDSFSPNEQDIAAIALIDEQGALDDVLSGNYYGFVSKTRGVWESFKLKSADSLARLWQSVTGQEVSGYQYAGGVTTPTRTRTATPINEEFRKKLVYIISGLLLLIGVMMLSGRKI